MGICLSKKKKKKAPVPAPPSSPSHEKNRAQTPKVVVQQQQQQKQPEKVVATEREDEVHERKPVFLITPGKKKTKQLTSRQPEVEATKVVPVFEKKTEVPEKSVRRDGGLEVAEEAQMVPVRASSCTKEEVESILIQCGRLSRSSSGKGVSEGGNNGNGGGRKYSGTKRSYDFDSEKKEGVEEEWDKGASSSSTRPSPRRRAPSRERDGGRQHKRSDSRERDGGREHKRSDSRERASGGGGRRGSRSPGRRSDGLFTNSSSSIDRPRQPGKMISVPAREKGNNNNIQPVTEDGRVNRRAPSPSPAVAGGVRSSSPRSRSPANIRVSNDSSHPSQQPPQSLSRSSSKKAEHSPYRRNPMAEIDDNSLRAEKPPSRSNNAQNSHCSNSIENEKVARTEVKASSQKTKPESNSNSIGRVVREQRRRRRLPESEIAEDAPHPKTPPSNTTNADVIEPSNSRTVGRTRSSRRSSRDLDAVIGYNPETHHHQNSYASMLLEDINNYHHQTTGFSLPACVSKACSILDALADLNSSSSDDKKAASTNASDGLVESAEVAAKNDDLHKKYVFVRDKLRMGVESAPEESAGSNSFVWQPWAGAKDQPNSVDDSSDCCWTSSWSNTAGEEVETSGAMSEDRHHHHEQVVQTKHQGLLEAANELAARGRKQTATTPSSNGSLHAAAPTSGSRMGGLDHRHTRRVRD